MAVRRGLDDPVEGTDVAYVNRDMQACTAQKRDGAFCDGKSLPDAPFPICLKHAAQVMAFLDDVMPRDLDDRLIVAWRAFEQRQASEADRKRRGPALDVVYYVLIGQHVKIGYSSNLPTRLRQYPPNYKLLAYEPGGAGLEAQRHAQFADELRMGREWFEPSPRLMQHIDKTRAAHMGAAA